MRSLVTWGVSSAVSLLCLLLISHPAWAQIQFDDKVIAEDAAASELFGSSVSVSGNVAFVGAYLDDDRGQDVGSVYIYEQNDGNWAQVGKLVPDDGAASDHFGWSVSVSGDYAFVGSRLDDDRGSSSGSVYVYERIDGIWRFVRKLTPNDGASSDQFGYSVSVSGDLAVVGALSDDNGNVANTGSAYVFERVNGTWTQRAKLIASDAQASDQFGYSVSISGDVIFAGARDDDDKGSASGSVYVFERNQDDDWVQVSKLTAPFGFTNDNFGHSVSVSGNVAVVGAQADDSVTPGSNNILGNAGSAYVFERIDNDWKQVARLTAEDDATTNVLFGSSVSVSGDRLMVGAYTDDDGGGTRTGSAYVFERFDDGWRRTTKLVANDRAVSDQFGFSVSLDGGFALVGASADDTPRGVNAGSAYFFRLGEDDVPWARGQSLLANENQPLNINLTGESESAVTFALVNAPANGSLDGFNAQTGAVTYTPEADFYGVDSFTFRVSSDGRTSEPSAVTIMVLPDDAWSQFDGKVFAADGSASDLFGSSVSISGNTALVGTYLDDDRGRDVGSVYIYEQSNGSWAQVGKLVPDDGAASDHFGWSVSVSGDYAFVGSRLDDDRGSSSGSVYVYERIDGIWRFVRKLTPNDGASSDQFGYSVSVSGDLAVVGALSDDNGNVANTGSAYVFERVNGTWTQRAKLIASDAQASDQFGYSVSISGDVIFVGARDDDDKGSASGSAYVFERNQNDSWTQVSKLTAPFGFTNDNFGHSVAVDGDFAVVGAQADDSVTPGNNNILGNAGSAYVFERIDNDWKQVARLTAEDDATTNVLFGSSVSISGNVLVVGAYTDEDDNGTRAGSTYFFERFEQGWRRTTKVVANDRAVSDQFGFSVAIDGRNTIIGASADDTPRGVNAGSVYFFDVENRSGLFANQLAVTTPEETPVGITLTGQGAQNLTFELLSQPSNGVLSGFNAQTGAVTYTPAAGFDGADAFTFRVVANGEQSAPATVSITVTPVNDAPTANAQAVSTNEEVAVNITLTGNDPDGDDLTFALVGQPSNGVLSGFNAQTGAVTYTPADDFSGQDTFTFRVSDGELNSAPATVTVTVNAVNDAPTANAQTVSTNEDTAVNITLTGNDPDGDDLTFAVLQQPANGTLSNFDAQAGTVTYTPSSNFSGNDSFTFRVSDGQANSAAATVSITVNAINDAPVANAQSVSTNEDTAVNITLTGNDPDGDDITFALVDQPDNGVLSGFNAQTGTVTYTPADGFSGLDSFTFRVSDGQLNSATASVTITVNDVNDAPTANAQSVSTDEDTAVNITLTGADPDGDDLTFTILQQPSSGVLSGFNAQTGAVIYTPNDGFNGNDSFTFRVSDGEFDSAPATVSITVNAVNDAPTANAQTVSTNEETAVNITLTGNDPDGDDLTFAVLQQPANGTLSNFDAQAGTVTYTPADGFSGNDSFTFRVSDGALTSEAATVSITVNNVNDAPTANDQSVSTNEETAVNITLTGNDPDGDDLTFAVLQQPANGVLSNFDEDAGTVTYTPNDGFNGNDSFTFRVSDGEFSSAFATVSITVNNVNDAPTANDQSVSTNEDVAVVITLTGADDDGDDLTFAVLQQPANGALSDFDAQAGTVTYTPADGFNGNDSFTFRVSDGQASSDAATVSITVNAVNDAPTANDQTISTNEETAVNITLTGNDPDGDDLTFAVLQQPANGVLSNFDAQAGTVTYTPNDGFNGNDSFTFRVSDGEFSSAFATVSILVNNVNDAPTANDQSVSINENTAVVITLTGNDPDGDDLTFAVLQQPANGALSDFDADAGTVTYTPNDGFSGQDSFTFRVSDGQASSDAAVVSITVNDVNDAPVANDQTVTTDEDTAITITLTGNDPDGDDLTFAVLQQPTNGTLSNFDAQAGTVVYTPAEDFSGQDSFTFRVSDGQASSGPATVTINVEEGNDAPTVEFDIDGEDVEVNEGESVTLEVTVTDDENAQVSIEWDLDGDGQFDDAEGPSAVFRGNDGPQTVRVSVRASDGEQATVASLTVRVLNVAPEVTIEGPTEGEVGQELNFVAVAVDPAGEGDLLAYSWSFGDDGPNAFGPNSRRTFTEAGTYTVSVVVDDGEGGRTTESIEVEITAPLPEVFDTTIPLEGDEGEDLAFSAAATGVEPLTYRWDFGDGTEEVEGQAVTHAFGDNGTYIVTLTITDALERSVTFDESVTILNVAPSVTLLESILPPQEGEAFGFNATAIDPAGDNDTLTYRWDFGDGSEDQEGVDLTNVEHTYADSGTFELMLIVSDEDGGTTIVTRTINVGGQAPNITSLGGDATGVEASPVSFEADAADPGNDALTYRWDFGDGSPVQQGVDLTEVEHAYGDNGSYTVTLTVSDEDGSATATRDVLIVNAPPTVEIEGPTEGNEGQELLWVALGEDPAGDNDPLSYRWNFSDGATAEGRETEFLVEGTGGFDVLHREAEREVAEFHRCCSTGGCLLRSGNAHRIGAFADREGVSWPRSASAPIIGWMLISEARMGLADPVGVGSVP